MLRVVTHMMIGAGYIIALSFNWVRDHVLLFNRVPRVYVSGRWCFCFLYSFVFIRGSQHLVWPACISSLFSFYVLPAVRYAPHDFISLGVVNTPARYPLNSVCVEVTLLCAAVFILNAFTILWSGLGFLVVSGSYTKVEGSSYCQ